MNIAHIFLVLLFIYPLRSCQNRNQPGNDDNNTNKMITENINHIKAKDAVVNKHKQIDTVFVYSDTDYVLTVNKNSPELRIEKWTKVSDDNEERINLRVFDKNTNKQKQSILLPEDVIIDNNVEFDDYNFDGYMDFYVSYGMLSGNEFGYVYLYDKHKNRFILADEYSNLTSIHLRKSTKEIVSLNRSGAGAYWDERVYKYRNGKLILKQSRSQEIAEQNADSCLYHYVHKRRNSMGKMRTIKNIKTRNPRFE